MDAATLGAPGRTYGIEVRGVRVTLFDTFTVLTGGLKLRSPRRRAPA
jgi:hypothetical protein